MRIGIDASNIRAGGGITHLTELLEAVVPDKYGITEIIVWAGCETILRLPKKPWLRAIHEPILDRGAIQRATWQNYTLNKIATQYCDLLYVPGGTYLGNFRPYVAQLRNMLPFEFGERARFGYTSKAFWRLSLLHYLQKYTFSRASGVIYVSEYSKNVVNGLVKNASSPSAVIHHGINPRFLRPPLQQKPLTDYSLNKPFKFLYVSIVSVYKHQWHVANAIWRLRNQGIPVAIDFIGPSEKSSLERLNRAIYEYDPQGNYMRYLNSVPFAELHKHYHNADGFVFASSCESISNIIMEAMASGLPIACAYKGAMPEVLGTAGYYFDPEKPHEIASQLESLLRNPEERTHCAKEAYERAQSFSWQRCADETFSFLIKVAQGNI